MSLDAGGAIKGLESIGRAADRNLGRAESKLDKMGSRFQKAGVGMLAGAGLAATGLYKAGQAAADLEQAVGGTEAVFKDTSGVIDKFAKDAASNMGLSERAFREATTSIGGQLKGLGFSVEEAADQAIDLTGVAADLAATYGGTTAEAVQALGAAFRGEADPAERFNLFLNQNRVNAEAVALGLAETTSQVDAHAKAQAVLSLITKQSADALGQFSREAGSASGQMQIASAEFENAKAALGQSVAPILAEVAGGLADLAGGFTSANEASGGLLSKLATIGTIGLGAAGGLSFAVGKVISMRENLSKLTGPLKNTEGGLNNLGRAAGALGLVGAVAGLASLARESTKTRVDVNRMADALANLTAEGEENEKQFIRVLDHYGKLDGVVEQLAAENGEAATRFVDLAEAAGVSADEIGRFRDEIDDQRRIQAQATVDQEKNTEAINETVEAMGGYGAAADEVEESSEDVTAAVERQTEAFEGLLDATLAQFDADIGYRKSLNSTEDALDDVNTALKEHGGKSEEYQRAVLDAESALLDQADAAVRLYEDTVKAAGGTLSASDKTAIYKSELEKLASGLAPGSPLRKQLDAYIYTLAAVPGRVKTDILIEAGGSFGTLKELLGYLDAIGRHPVGSQITGFSGLLEFKQERMRAEGGPVAAGTPYVVGEEGPELFVPSSSGTIIPNGQLSTAGGTSAVGVVNNISIYTAADPQAVVEAVSRYVRTNGQPGWNR